MPGGTECDLLLVMAERDVKLPPKTAMSYRGKIDNAEGLKGGGISGLTLERNIPIMRRA